jgi:hypothetical protein
MYTEISHCYEREHAFNLWFTIAAPNKLALRKAVEKIRRSARIAPEDVLDLPSTRTFKIDVRFRPT